MIVTSIERTPKRRGRVDVYVDGVAAFEVAGATATAQGLRAGEPIDRARIDAIVAADRRRLALDTAVAMLARRPRSERDVRQRLARARFDEALVDDTLRRLRDAKLLDDADYARAYTETRDRTSPRGRRLIVQELRASGVTLDIARDAATAVSDGEAAYRLAARRIRTLAALDYRAFRDRLGSYLQRRGFDWETCRATVARCWAELGRDDAAFDGEADA
jgi:regulatory protein